MDGILNINKPPGKTSAEVVAWVKRLSAERRVGHAGTLDPQASGVLPVCLGQGTRVIEFLASAAKTYRAQVELGVATDTYDSEGKVTFKGDISGINREKLGSALNSFSGLIRQTPPMYSAIKYRGKPLYQLARAGISVKRKSRPAKIYKIELIDFTPPVATIEVVCGKGTYIRSLAHDLGRSLGCGAHLKGLIRLSYGIFDIKEAISLSQFDDAFRSGYWQRFVYPIDTVLLSWAAVVVSNKTAQSIKQGRPVVLENTGDSSTGDAQFPSSLSSFDDYCRAYTPDGCFVGMLRFKAESGQWQPEKVFLQGAK